MVSHSDLEAKQLRTFIRNGELTLAGNRKLRIYGKLSCSSGKRMKQENRVFFSSEAEAIEKNFRPCGHCMKVEYKRWIYSTKP